MQLFADAAYNWNVTVFALEVIALKVILIISRLNKKTAATAVRQ